MEKAEFASMLGAVWIPLIILAVTIAFSAIVRFLAAEREFSSKVLEMDRIHKTKMLELAVTTANSEFEVSQELLDRSGEKPRPMSSHVIFHFFLFSKLEDISKGYAVDAALQEAIDEVKKIFKVYAQSGIPEYGKVWNIHLPKPKRRAKPSSPA